MGQANTNKTNNGSKPVAPLESDNRHGRKPRKKTGRWKRHLMLVIILLVSLLSYPRLKALFGVGRHDPGHPGTNGATNGAETGPGSDTMASGKRGPLDINILLLGVDERSGDIGRSDTMILVNYDALYGTLHVMSIPRDTRVELPERGYQKINAAYAYGGAELSKQAVGDLTGLYIDYYCKVNFTGFSAVVDALGGVTIDIEDSMDYTDPYQDLHIHFEPGVQRLDGAQALEFVRWRGGPTADLGRVERQRKFLDAALRRAVSPAGLVRFPLVFSALGECVETDIPVIDRPGLLTTLALARMFGLTSVTMPGTTSNINGGSYFIADTEKLTEILVSWSRPPWTKNK